MTLSRLVLPLALACASTASFADTVRRLGVDVTGDFVLIGNTLGHSCATPMPVVGMVGRCVERSRFADLSPDLFWRAETSSAVADASVTPDRMRSTAMLALPPGARVTRAYLYWWGEVDDVVADTDVILERPGGALETFTATRSHSYVQPNVDAVQPTYAETLDYLSVTDVTDFVAAQGDGAYRVSGVDAHALDDNFNIAYAGWALVTVYERAGDPPRNVSLFDGIERAVSGTVGVALSGFQVPNAGFDGKLGIVGVDGEIAGSGVRFGAGRLTAADAISDAQNPVNRFFNGTRSYLGRAVSTPGDLPRTTGAPGSLGGVDFDVVDVGAKLRAGQTAASAEIVAGPNDGIQSLIWIISITTFRPDFEDATKQVRDLDGATAEVGDELEYTIRLHNRGNDAALGVVLSDPLPAGLEYVASSMTLTSSSSNGPLTDAIGDDAGEYDVATRTVRVRLGSAITSTIGGRVAPGEGAQLRFRASVTAVAASSRVSNQATIDARGAGGAPRATTETDGDPSVAGNQATEIAIEAQLAIDAGTPDATADNDATANPDAAARPDASAPRADATVAPDASVQTTEEGCDCSQTRGAPSAPSALLVLGLLLALRSRRRAQALR